MSGLAFQNIMYMDMEPVMNPTATMVRAAYDIFSFFLARMWFFCVLFYSFNHNQIRLERSTESGLAT